MYIDIIYNEGDNWGILWIQAMICIHQIHPALLCPLWRFWGEPFRSPYSILLHDTLLLLGPQGIFPFSCLLNHQHKPCFLAFFTKKLPQDQAWQEFDCSSLKFIQAIGLKVPVSKSKSTAPWIMKERLCNQSLRTRTIHFIEPTIILAVAYLGPKSRFSHLNGSMEPIWGEPRNNRQTQTHTAAIASIEWT